MIEEKIREYVSKIDARLDIILSESGQHYDEVVRAGRYSLLNGGKRIRPILLLEFYKLCGGEDDCAYNFACALEMIHTYSLIHDDLPCMDDDDMRRGKPSCHKQYGEAMALLAGDALLTEAFGTAAKTIGIPSDAVVRALAQLSSLSGVGGMIGGQVMDIAGTVQNDDDFLFEMYRLKTGALIRAAAVCGCILADADDDKISAAAKYAEKLGLAFQIIDDILDATGDAKLLGKPVGSDEKNNKDTIVVRLGLEHCRSLADRYTNEALAALDEFDGDKTTIVELTQFLLLRNY